MKKIIHNIKNVIYLLKPYWRYGKLYMILSFLMSVIIWPLNNILNVYFHKTVLDSIIEGQNFINILFIIAFFEFFIFFIPLIQGIVYTLYFHIQQQKIMMNINRDIFVKSVKTDYKYFDNTEFYNNYTMTIAQYSQQSSQASMFLAQLLSSVTTMIAMTSIIAATDLWILVITVITLAASTVVGNINNKTMFKNFEELNKEDRRLFYIQRMFYSNYYAADIKSTNVKDYLFDNYDNSVKNKFNILKKYAFKMIGFGQIQSFMRQGLNFIIVAYVAYKIVHGEITVGNFAGMIAASASLQNSLGMFFNFINQADQMSIYTDKMKSFLELKSEIEDPPQSDILLSRIPEGPFNIEIKNVNFAYENSKFALKDINIKINKGEKIAIVGENGGGKSTLTKLLLRLYDVSSGEILINGEPIKNYDINKLRRSIGIAFQNTNLYALTLSENMQLYHKIPDEKLYEVIDKVGLNPVLEKSKNGLNTQLTKEFDNEGIFLSGGETQRMGLSRIFSGEFGLLLLDEPSAALDPLAEYKLNKIIFDRQSKTTTIIISHRLSTVRDADCIYLIDNGIISESGTHGQLMSKQGKYYEMFTKQAENYIKS